MNDIVRLAPGQGSDPLSIVLSRHLKFGGQVDSRVHDIAFSVAEAIIRGELHLGQDLNSVELARRFRSSRTPVREALLLLEKQGLVEVKARRRPRVAQVSIETVRDVYHAYAALASYVAEVVATKATAADIARLEGFHVEMVRAAGTDDLSAYILAITEIRDTSNQICGNAIVQQMLDTLSVRRLQLRHLIFSEPGSLARAAADHGRLILAYEARSPGLAAALQKAIVLDALRTIELHWDSVPPKRHAAA